MNSGQPVIISLSESDLTLANRLAQGTYERWKAAPGHYNNTKNSHFRGKVGEIAVHRWAVQQGVTVEPVYEDLDRERECDLIVPGLRIEVKTWAEKWWADLGRCFAVQQIKSLERKADLAVIGYMMDESRDSSTVCLAGWADLPMIKAAPVRFTGPEWGRQVKNHQLEECDLRSMHDLARRLIPE